MKDFLIFSDDFLRLISAENVPSNLAPFEVILTASSSNEYLNPWLTIFRILSQSFGCCEETMEMSFLLSPLLTAVIKVVSFALANSAALGLLARVVEMVKSSEKAAKQALNKRFMEDPFSNNICATVV